MKKGILLLLILIVGTVSFEVEAQGSVSIKTDALHSAAFTSNPGIEVELGHDSIFARFIET